MLCIFICSVSTGKFNVWFVTHMLPVFLSQTKYIVSWVAELFGVPPPPFARVILNIYYSFLRVTLSGSLPFALTFIG